MPIIDVEFVGETPGDRKRLASTLADALGVVFESPPASTWVRLRSLASDEYAENQTTEPEGRRAVFVTVKLRSLPSVESRKQLARQIAATVAEIFSQERVHVLFEAVGGRIAFGGELVE